MSDRGYKGMSLQIQAQAVQAEIEGMKIENTIRIMNGQSPSYGEDSFDIKACELQRIANQMLELVNQ